MTSDVDRRVPNNKALTIHAEKGEFHLGLKALDKPDAIKILKGLIESRLPKSDLADVLIDIDNRTNFLRHFLPPGTDTVVRRRDTLAALLAIGCNIGCQRMALASGLNLHEITLIADWYLTEDTLKAASIDIINFASRIPVSQVYGRGATVRQTVCASTCPSISWRLITATSFKAGASPYTLTPPTVSSECTSSPFPAGCGRRLSA